MLISTRQSIAVCATLLTIHSRPNRIPRLVHQDARIILKLDQAAILPLHFLLYTHHDRMSQIPSSYFICDSTAMCRLGSEAPLFLDDNHDAITFKQKR